MALTATASKSTRKFVSNALGMEKPHLVILSPDKPNIVYNVVPKTGSIDATFHPLVEEIRCKRRNTAKTII